MIERLSRFVLLIILLLSIFVGIYLGWQRHIIESQSRTVELATDYNDLKVLSSVSNVSFDKLLSDLKNCGITSIGVFEETLPSAGFMGEIIYSTGSGILRNPSLIKIFEAVLKKKLLDTSKTYVFCDNPIVRKRIYSQLLSTLPQNKLKIIGGNVFEISDNPIALSDIGVGMSEVLDKYLVKKGYSIIPRVWNNPNYNISSKIKLFSGYSTIIFDGDEIMGYPDQIEVLAKGLKNKNIKYGNVEIVKQDGDKKLKKIMGLNIVRVHSVPKDELKKIKKEEAIGRFVKAAKERSIRLIYVRPFLPPQVTSEAVPYNMEYVSSIKNGLENSGFLIGKASNPIDFEPFGWQILVLGFAVIIAFFLLFDYFVKTPWWLVWCVLFISIPIMVSIGANRSDFLLEKALAFIAVVVFPSYAVISQFSIVPKKSGRIFWDITYIFLNIIAETVLGIFILLGLLSNTYFMMGVQSFSGIKIALVLPILIVSLYFFFKTEKGFDYSLLKTRVSNILNMAIPVWILMTFMLFIVIIFVLLARSGNFVLPVSGFEKNIRILLEKILYARPRTKEFLIGYPFLIMSALIYIKGDKKWLPAFLAIGTIGPTSLVNTFCHIHSPIVVSMLRSFNGLILGLFISLIACSFIMKFKVLDVKD